MKKAIAGKADPAPSARDNRPCESFFTLCELKRLRCTPVVPLPHFFPPDKTVENRQQFVSVVQGRNPPLPAFDWLCWHGYPVFHNSTYPLRRHPSAVRDISIYNIYAAAGAMVESSSQMAGRRRESTTRSPSVWSQAGWIMSAGGLLGVVMSVLYYRALGPPQFWIERDGLGAAGGRGAGSWWLRKEGANVIGSGASAKRRLARNEGSLGGERFRTLLCSKQEGFRGRERARLAGVAPRYESTSLLAAALSCTCRANPAIARVLSPLRCRSSCNLCSVAEQHSLDGVCSFSQEASLPCSEFFLISHSPVR